MDIDAHSQHASCALPHKEAQIQTIKRKKKYIYVEASCHVEPSRIFLIFGTWKILECLFSIFKNLLHLIISRAIFITCPIRNLSKFEFILYIVFIKHILSYISWDNSFKTFQNRLNDYLLFFLNILLKFFQFKTFFNLFVLSTSIVFKIIINVFQ